MVNLGIRTYADPKGPPLYYFEVSLFVTDPKMFLQAPLAPICTNIDGGARADKRNFFGQNFQESGPKPLFDLLFQSSACGPENVPETNVFLVL